MKEINASMQEALAGALDAFNGAVSLATQQQPMNKSSCGIATLHRIDSTAQHAITACSCATTDVAANEPVT